MHPHDELKKVFKEKYPDAVMLRREVFLVMLFGRLFASFEPAVAAGTKINQMAFELGKKDYIMSSATAGFEEMHDGLVRARKRRSPQQLVDHVASIVTLLMDIETGHRMERENDWLKSLGQPPLDPLDTEEFPDAEIASLNLVERLGTRLDAVPVRGRSPAVIGSIAFEEIKSGMFIRVGNEERSLRSRMEPLQNQAAA